MYYHCKVETLPKELDYYKLSVEKLSEQLKRLFATILLKSFTSDEYKKFHIRLSNFKLVKPYLIMFQRDYREQRESPSFQIFKSLCA